MRILVIIFFFYLASEAKPMVSLHKSFLKTENNDSISILAFKSYFNEQFKIAIEEKKGYNMVHASSQYNSFQNIKLFGSDGPETDLPSPFAFYLVKIDTMGKLYFTKNSQSKYVLWDGFEDLMKEVIEKAPLWNPIPKDSLSFMFVLNIDSVLYSDRTKKTNFFESNPKFYLLNNSPQYSELVSFIGFNVKPKNPIGNTSATCFHLPLRICDTTFYDLTFLNEHIFKTDNFYKKQDSLINNDVRYSKRYYEKKYTYIPCPYYKLHYAYESGQLRVAAIGNVDRKNRRVGYWNIYSYNGKIQASGVFHKYEYTNKVVSVDGYSYHKAKGHKIGLWKIFDDKGHLTITEEYNSRGKLLKRGYLENGKIKRVEVYKHNKLTKVMFLRRNAQVY